MFRSILIIFGFFLILQACNDNSTGNSEEPETEVIACSGPISNDSLTIVMSNLDSPRGLSFGPEGGLYVAEAGNTNITGACVSIGRGQNCYSGTGAISRFSNGMQERIASNLPSVFNPAANDITGPHHVSFQGSGNVFTVIGWGAEPQLRDSLGQSGDDLGVLVQILPGGGFDVVADLSSIEQTQNPDEGDINANPYGLFSESGGHFVTDAGGNSLLEVNSSGDVSIIATFPRIDVPPSFNPPFAVSEAVPTMVTRGPDNALYVSTLTGVPFVPGAASIYRVEPGQAPQIFAGEFTAITDIAWGPDGSLYVVQYASEPFLGGKGALIRVASDGTRTTISDKLTNPTGVAVGSNGVIFVSNRGNVAGSGEVVCFQK